MIKLTKISHRGQNRILVSYDYDTKLVKLIKQISNSRYTKTYKGFYFPYDKKSYTQIIKTLKENNYKYDEETAIIKDFNYISKKEKEIRSLIIDFVDYMKYKHYSKSTIKTYSSIVYMFLKTLQKEPQEISFEDIKKYNKTEIIDKGFSLSYQNQFINALKLFLQKNKPENLDIDEIERPRKSEYLPVVLSKKEIKLIFDNITNLKHRTILSLIYSSGLRIGEALRLKVKDIDSGRNVILIRQSKGYKDRVVGLSPKILELLREYYKKYKPKNYLFEGQNGGMYSASSVRQVFSRTCKKAGIKKSVRIHNLRHSYATHLLENGTDLRYIQDILGHKSPKTTMIYTHVSNKSIKNIISPFDLLDE